MSSLPASSSDNWHIFLQALAPTWVPNLSGFSVHKEITKNQTKTRHFPAVWWTDLTALRVEVVEGRFLSGRNIHILNGLRCAKLGGHVPSPS